MENENNDAVRFAELKALAEKATPGPWWTEPSYADNGEYGGLDVVTPVAIIINGECAPNNNDAAFIAAANPAAILALIAAHAAQSEALASQALRVAELEREVAQQRKWKDEWHGHYNRVANRLMRFEPVADVWHSVREYDEPKAVQPAQQPGDDENNDDLFYPPKAMLKREDWDATTRKPKVQQPGDVRSDLHSAIMNLPSDPSKGETAFDRRAAYLFGHRDARHAAAELVAAAEGDAIAAARPSAGQHLGMLFAGSQPSEHAEAVRAAHDLAKWLAAALDDPAVCGEYKAAINKWFDCAMPSADLLAAARDVMATELGEMACTGSMAPCEDALGRLSDAILAASSAPDRSAT